VKKYLFLFIILFCSLTNSYTKEPVYPEPTGYVNDFANILSPLQESQLTTLITQLEEKTSAQIAIATLETTEPLSIDDYAVQLFTRWAVGQEGKDNGILIVVAVKDRKVWIEVGYGLEGMVPDAFASEVYREELVPAFRRGDYGVGLFKATSRLADRIAKESGVSLNIEKIPEPQSRGLNLSWLLNFLPLLLILFFLFFFLSFRRGPLGGFFSGLPRSGGYWSTGGRGGFGGGFGGFGGGRTGGGGAGGGW